MKKLLFSLSLGLILAITSSFTAPAPSSSTELAMYNCKYSQSQATAASTGNQKTGTAPVLFSILKNDFKSLNKESPFAKKLLKMAYT